MALPLTISAAAGAAQPLAARHRRSTGCNSSGAVRRQARSAVMRIRAQQQEQQQQEQQQGQRQQASAPQRAALAAAAAALTAALLAGPVSAADEAVQPVFFGNGCFWGRQYDFVNTEKALGRVKPEQMSALVGYAGGRAPAPGKVCYYGGDQGTVYEELGHAEVVQVDLRGDPQAASEQYRAFAKTYFSQFRKTPFGMLRLDPQDAGPGYRNVIGIPGGVDSPLFAVLQEENVNGMRLLPGEGGAYDASGRPTEGDEFNTVWVVDSNRLGFNRAEQWHQFHNGLGKSFPAAYTRDLKAAMAAAGKIAPTGCPEYGALFTATAQK